MNLTKGLSEIHLEAAIMDFTPKDNELVQVRSLGNQVFLPCGA